jgi:5-methylcytosine-specific restriction protein B
MRAGSEWELMGQSEQVKSLLDQVFDERMHKSDRGQYQLRVNLQKKSDVASYAGFIVEEGNPSSGPYQGTSFVWFPGEGGSVVALGIGTDGFGADTAILGRPGHGRRLRALARMHAGHLWVKPDLLDISTEVPDAVASGWPTIDAARKAYARVLYATASVKPGDSGAAHIVRDLLDLFFHEHRTRHKGTAQEDWRARLADIHSHVFPAATAEDVESILRDRRFAILEGPPGTGKTRLALQVGAAIGSHEMVQFHPARTYEDFVVGLYPRIAGDQLAFEVRPGDLLRANKSANGHPHLLVIDEINRADLGRVLGEAVSLFEPGEPDRAVRLPHVPDGYPESLQLSPHLLVLGTRNTADRSIARIDLAIRRRFAFIDVWPSLQVVQDQHDALATQVFQDILDTFTEWADDDALRLVPGHAYFLDPRPDLTGDNRPTRIRRRLSQELLPLLRDYVSERLLGPATLEVAGLADRIEGFINEV